MNGGMDMNNGSDAIAEKEEAPIFPMSKQTLFFYARTARSKLPLGNGTHHYCMQHGSKCFVDTAVVQCHYFLRGLCPNCFGYFLGRRDSNDGSRNGFFHGGI